MINKAYNLGLNVSGESIFSDSFGCYANLPNSFTFTPDGKIRKCTVSLDKDDNCVGDLNAGVNVKNNDNWSNDKYDQCHLCKMYPVCLGTECKNVKNTFYECQKIKEEDLVFLFALKYNIKDYEIE